MNIIIIKNNNNNNNNHHTLQIRGKDLVGGVKVMPMGLDAAIKKRTSGEFKMEVIKPIPACMRGNFFSIF